MITLLVRSWSLLLSAICLLVGRTFDCYSLMHKIVEHHLFVCLFVETITICWLYPWPSLYMYTSVHSVCQQYACWRLCQLCSLFGKCVTTSDSHVATFVQYAHMLWSLPPIQELLKYTDRGHPDCEHIKSAVDEMKAVAHTVNERKRRVENIHFIGKWRRSVDNWEVRLSCA